MFSCVVAESHQSRAANSAVATHAS